jgi:hypothetical protein
MLTWIAAARQDDPVAHPDHVLPWKQLDSFNQRIYEIHRGKLLDVVLEYFHEIHNQFMAMIKIMSEEELLTPGVYAFIDKDSVYAWLDKYADHDRWGRTHIVKWLETGKKNVNEHPVA